MKNYSQADMAFQKLIDSMKQDANTHPTIEELAKAFDSVHDRNGEDDENFICIPMDRYEELLRSESEIDILCTIVESPYVTEKTALAALESVADMRDKRLNEYEDNTDEE